MTEAAIPWFNFLLAVLAVWRVAHLIVSEDGPGGIIVRLRKYLGQSTLGQLMDCFGCASLWIALPLALFVTTRVLEFIVVWLAVSGGAMLLERLVPEQLVIERAAEPLEGDQSNDVLR